MPYVPVPKDLTKVKTKVAFNLTKRQLIFFSIAGAVGLPVYFLTRTAIGNTASVLLMIGLMMPFFFMAMYERDGQPADSAVLVLAALVAGVIADQRFGLDCMRPESVRATNITSGDQATNNVALWTVTWKQAVDVSHVITWPELDDFLRCYTREKKDGPVTIETHLPGASAGKENTHV